MSNLFSNPFNQQKTARGAIVSNANLDQYNNNTITNNKAPINNEESIFKEEEDDIDDIFNSENFKKDEINYPYTSF